MTPIRTALCTAVLASTSFLAVAQADEPSRNSVDVARVVVKYGDLDLASDRGVMQLQRRLMTAAHKVCGRPDPRNLNLAARAQQCVDEAMLRAVTDVGSPQLARLNATRGKSLRG